jgi:hypothetical protein
MSRVENRLAIFGWEKSAPSRGGQIPGKPTGGRFITDSVALLVFAQSRFPTSKPNMERILLPQI